MKRPSTSNLSFGTNVVAELLPHSRPLLLVDRVISYSDVDVPELEAVKHLSANEPIFSGHFPHLHIWPGIFTLEGLGQSCYLLYLILQFRRGWEKGGGDPDAVFKALQNLDLGYRLHPGFNPDLAEAFRDQVKKSQSRIGVSSAVEMKFLQPVFGGCRLDYRVRLDREVNNQVRFDAVAEVEGTPVARGFLTVRIDIILPSSHLESE